MCIGETDGGLGFGRLQKWQAPTLLNSWVNYGSTQNAAGYFLDNGGIVHLRGLVKNGSAIPTTIFTLPTRFLPEKQEIFVVNSYDSFGRCNVNSDGTVVAQIGNTAWFCLDGITFRSSGA